MTDNAAVCPHTSWTCTDDPDVWECDNCGRLRRTVLDPSGPVLVFEPGRAAYRIRYESVAP